MDEIEELTWREQEVLALLAKRLTNREIAAQLHLAESTVKDYVSNILGKLYVKNRRQAVEKGKALGLLGAARKERARSAARLPSFPAPFIGRSNEINTIKQQLEETRLLTISGPGGAGKTRLAVQVAREIQDHFEHGAFLVSLAPIQYSEHIVQAVAEALAIPLATSEEPVRQLIRYLQKKKVLLVIDNFEHLLDGTPLLEQILEYAPKVNILATSRERLNLPGEINVLIGGLAISDRGNMEDTPRSDATDLFVQSARRARPNFTPTSSDLEQIAAICRTIQGMPLAIELAAAWLNVLSLPEIQAEIEQSFDILASEMRAVPERHRSMRTVFEQSWSMLQANEQELFTRISVFAGGFTRPAAEHIAEADIAALRRLVNKSIIRYDPESGRFDIHELLRQYAQERLQLQPEEYESTLKSHARYFADFMHQKWDQLRGSRQLEAFREMDADMENIRLAWRFYVQQANAAQIQKFLNSFWLVYWIRGWNLAAVQLFDRAVESLAAYPNEELATTVRAHAMANQAFYLAWLGQAEKGYKLALESIEILETRTDPVALYFAYHGLTLAAYYLARLEEEIHANNQMLKIAHAQEDKWLIAFGYFLHSISVLRTRDLVEAERLAKLGLEESRAIQDLCVQAMCLNTLGHLASWRGEFQLAREYYQRCLEASGKLGFHWQIGNATKYLGQVAVKMESYREAEAYFLNSLRIADDLGLDREIANLLFEFAHMRAAEGRNEQAVEILGVLMQLPANRLQRLASGPIIENAEELLAELEAAVPAEAFSVSLNRGKAADPDQFLAALLHSHAKEALR